MNTSKLYTYMTFFLFDFVDSNNQFSRTVAVGGREFNSRARLLLQPFQPSGTGAVGGGLLDTSEQNTRAEGRGHTTGQRGVAAERKGQAAGKYKFIYLCNIYHETLM